MVDWSARLWPASYRGVPFYVETHAAPGRRRIVSHEFPMRDEPFHEDLGRGLRTFDVQGYVASDSALLQASALDAVLAAGGQGVLVLPDVGPVTVRCTEWRRDHARDRLGYVAFSATFVREGAALGLVGVGLVAALVVEAAAALGTIADRIGARLEVSGLPGAVRDAAVEGLRNVAVTLEDLRGTRAVATDISATVRDDLTTYYAAVPDLVAASAGAGLPLVEAARALGDGMDPADAMAAFGELADALPPEGPVVTATPSQAAILRNAARVDRMSRLAALAAYAEAIVRAIYGSRREGVAARAAAAERFGIAIADLGGAENVDALLAVLNLRDQTISWLSQAITDLKPVVDVSAARALPALWWSWRLYADPTRAGELVARNRAAHPQFMPQRFEALAP